MGSSPSKSFLPQVLAIPLLLFGLGCSTSFVKPKEGVRQECVVLLHGLARTSRSMHKLQTRLLKEGYAVCNSSYPSRRESIERLAATAVVDAVTRCRESGAEKIHFVTHSMGGIVLRFYLKNQRPEDLGRVVMLSPPNQGTEVVDVLGHNPLFTFLYGPAGNQLGTDERSLPKKLGKVDFELGVITGTRSVNLLLSLIIPGKDDGKVSVSSARVCGMKEFATREVSHPFIMRNQEIIEMVLRFLSSGTFAGRESERAD